MSLTLTDQQRAVVDHPAKSCVSVCRGRRRQDHRDGASHTALHAVGACLTCRFAAEVRQASVERLVRDKAFAPDRILATSFGLANIDNLKRARRAWPQCGACAACSLA